MPPNGVLCCGNCAACCDSVVLLPVPWFLILISIATHLRKPTQLRGNHEYLMRGLEALSHDEDLHFERMPQLKSVMFTETWGHELTSSNL